MTWMTDNLYFNHTAHLDAAVFVFHRNGQLYEIVKSQEIQGDCMNLHQLLVPSGLTVMSDSSGVRSDKFYDKFLAHYSQNI